MKSNRVLEGIRVFELTQVISGSYAGMLLGDLGADVIKAERPDGGEFYRTQAMKNELGVSVVYPNYNRNKRSVTVNIGNPQGVELCKKIIANSDIFIENYRAGSLAKKGLGYDELKKINPNLIMVSITGFGQDGPYAKKAAYDMTVSAMSGFMSLNGPEGEPTKSGPAVSDFLSGIYGAMAALAALRHRDQTGEGQFIDVAMLDCSISILDAFFAQYAYTGVEPRGTGNRRANYAPVNAFKTQDGAVYLSCSTEQQWENLVTLMNKPELLTDPRFCARAVRKEHEVDIEAIVQSWTKGYTTKQLIVLLEEHDVPCAPVNGVKEIMDDPQIHHRGSIQNFDYPGLGQYPSVPFVPRFSSIETQFNRAPILGEHNDDIYGQELGIDEATRAALKADKVI